MNKIQNVSSNLIQTKVGLITQDWNIVPIDKVIKLSQYGLSISTDENGAIPIIGMKHLVDGKVEIDNLSCVSISDEEQKKFCLKKGDILLNRTNSYELVGKVSLFDFDYKLIVFASYLVRFQFNKNKVLPEFANYFLNSYPAQHYLKRLATKAVSQANINPSVFRKLFLLPIPSLEEQKKIAKILSTWDKAIALTEKLIAAKQKQKKGLMQKIFRNREWKQERLKKIVNILTDGTHQSPKSKNGNYKYITSKNIRFGYLDLKEVNYISEKEHNQIYSGCPVKKGDVLLTKDGVGAGNVAINSLTEPFSLLSSVALIRGKTEILYNPFLVQFILSSGGQKIIKAEISGQAITRLTLKQIGSLKIPLPPVEEQKKISNFLEFIDKNLILLESKLKYVKEQKKGLMQKLLTGEWRVNVEKVLEETES